MALLESKNLKLRALEPEDLELLYKWENDTTIWRCGNTISPYSRYTIKQYIAEVEHDIYKSNQLRFMIHHKEDGHAIGTVDIFDFDAFHSRAGVGILIDPNYQGKGYASETLKLIMDYCFSFLKMHQLFAHIPRANQASVKLFSANKFTESGILKDWISSSAGYSDVLVYQAVNEKH